MSPATNFGLPRDDAFLQPKTDADSVYPLRAKLVRAGALYETVSATAPANTNKPRSAVRTEIVLASGASRVRLLCTEKEYRIAVWVDRVDLALVARSPIVIVARAPLPVAPTPLTPGIHLAAGEAVDLVGAPPTRSAVGGAIVEVRVHYRGLSIDGSGLVSSSQIDEVFEPSPEPEPRRRSDAESPSGATFLDSPAGALLGRVTNDAPTTSGVLVTTLGTKTSGYVLARHDDGGGGAAIVGWVRTSELRMLAKGEGIGVGGGGTGLGVFGLSETRPTVVLAAGTRLDGGDGVPMGVVTKKVTLPCVERCGATDPVVEVYACSDVLRVRSHRVNHLQPCPAAACLLGPGDDGR